MRPRSIADALPWVLRLVWVVLPFTVGPASSAALRDASTSVRTLASAGLWVGWGVGVVATFVPHPLGLTALRVLAPAATAWAVAAAFAHDAEAARLALALTWSALATAWIFAPATGAWCVNGLAYPNERRFPLRPPGALVAGLLLLAWAASIAGLSAGPLLLAARRWVIGAIALALGLPLAVVLLRALHGLSRRWLVFVPAGVVLHDPLTLVDPVLFRRETVAELRPATAGTDALDLSQGALGLALELELRAPAHLVLVRPGRRAGEPRDATKLLFTPTRPGAVIEEAQARRVPTG